MALINCPECNKEVSDQAQVCPNCGVSINKQKKKTSKKIKIIAIIVAVVIVLCGIGAFVGLKIHNNKIEQERLEQERIELERIAEEQRIEQERIEQKETLYKQSLTDISSLMKQNIDTCKMVLDMVNMAWSSNGTSISVDTVRRNLYSGDSIVAMSARVLSVSDIEIAKKMTELENPPEKYTELHKAVNEMYEYYKSLSAYAQYPVGEYAIFSYMKDTLSSEFDSAYNKVQELMD